MKKLVIVCLLGLFTLATVAHADHEEDEKILGAIAGGYLGSTIGSGDGRKAATVVGAILGYNLGPQILGTSHHHTYDYGYHGRHNNYHSNRSWRQPRYRQADIYEICKYRNPYPRDSRMYWSYNRGCVQRLSQEMREMEQDAYEQGYRDQ